MPYPRPYKAAAAKHQRPGVQRPVASNDNRIGALKFPKVPKPFASLPRSIPTTGAPFVYWVAPAAGLVPLSLATELVFGLAYKVAAWTVAWETVCSTGGGSVRWRSANSGCTGAVSAFIDSTYYKNLPIPSRTWTHPSWLHFIDGARNRVLQLKTNGLVNPAPNPLPNNRTYPVTIPVANPWPAAPAAPGKPGCRGQPSTAKAPMPEVPWPAYSPSPATQEAFEPPATAGTARPGQKSPTKSNAKPAAAGSPKGPPKWPSPPKPGTKEKKAQLSGAGAAAWAALNTATEVADLIDSLHDALPKPYQAKGRPTPFEKAMAVYEHFDKVDIEAALENWLNNEIEDAVYGKTYGLGGKKLNQLTGSPTGGGSATGGKHLPDSYTDENGEEQQIDRSIPLPTVDIDFQTCSLTLNF